MNGHHECEPFITAEFRPQVVPGLEHCPPLDPDCPYDEIRRQALGILGLSERAWEALHPELSARDFWKCRFRHNPEVTWNTLDGETVLLHTKTSRYYTLNGSASKIWAYFDGSRDLEGIVTAVCADFEVDRNTAKNDLLAFTGKLLTEDALHEEVDRERIN